MSAPPSHDPAVPSTPRRHRGLALLATGGLTLLAGVVVFSGKSDSKDPARGTQASLIAPSSPDKTRPNPAPGDRAPASMSRPSTPSTPLPRGTVELPPDDLLRQHIVGSWYDEHYGKRELTVRPDGTATMRVTLDSIGAFLYGKVLRFDIAWELADGRLKFETVGGEPLDKVRAVGKMWGDKFDQEILQLDEQAMILLDEDGETIYDWERVDTPR